MKNSKIVKKEEAHVIIIIEVFNQSEHFLKLIQVFMLKDFGTYLNFSSEEIYSYLPGEETIGILILSEDGKLYIFDKTHKMHVIIPRNTFTLQILQSDSIHNCLDKFLVTFKKPSLDVKISFCKKTELFSISYVLLANEYTKLRKVSTKSGNLLFGRKDRNLPFVEYNINIILNYLKFQLNFFKNSKLWIG
jgi:hypothetical protein